RAPIVYFVDRLRDGSSFTTRRVTAIQHGQAIFNLSASFHITEPGVAHQPTMPDVPGPEGLQTELDAIREVAARIPDEHRAAIVQERPIDFRPVLPLDFFSPEPRDPVRHVWFKSIGSLPDDQLTHQAVLSYASDYGLLTTALQPHGIAFRAPGLQLASLDHSVWMHRPFRADEWMLYSVDSPIATGARAFVRGQIFSQGGELVASVSQEGLVRLRQQKPK
ncbi:MAG: acyl-CoA thioesterase II, partial [Gemmatimonadaceae bacterium]